MKTGETKKFIPPSTLLLFILALTAYGTKGQTQEPDSGNSECNPPCRTNYMCLKGKCVSPCNPPCAINEVCTQSGRCIPSVVPTMQTGPAAIPGIGIAAKPVPMEVDRERVSSRSKHRTRRSRDNPHFAVLTNPFAIALNPLVYGIFVIPLEIQGGGNYLAVDVQGTLFLIDGEPVGGIGELGLRIMPMGRGLKGFYIVPRIGGGSPAGFMGTGELGFAVFPGHFVMNFGAGCGGASNVGFVWFGNISLGFGG